MTSLLEPGSLLRSLARNHEHVPAPLIESISKLGRSLCYKTLQTLLRNKQHGRRPIGLLVSQRPCLGSLFTQKASREVGF